jgi:putative glycosyltransferase (TIGR04348 family)
MKIHIITPAPENSRAGNRATAMRWARFLTEGGHTVTVSVDYHGEKADMMVALHAWRSAAAIKSFNTRYSDRPLVVALTGTDIYRFQFSHPEICYDSMDRATRLVGLHGRVFQDIPQCYQNKLRIIYQSAQAASAPFNEISAPNDDSFLVCVIGHLRDEKDALRAAFSVRNLPDNSRIKVIQAGKAHDESWGKKSRREERHNARYRWLGEISREQVSALMSRSRLMVISSIMEGGANVVSEACMAGLPILASEIPGNTGLLGDDFPGYNLAVKR